ncbi:glycoside hydrolase family 30 protein [Tengunoibacter tsumagoiensis]|nr:glycoside hydrolase family 30 protein [Tengunoibacter tsumagoiensis]
MFKRFISVTVPPVIFVLIIIYIFTLNTPPPPAVLASNSPSFQLRGTPTAQVVYPNVAITLTTTDQQNRLSSQPAGKFSDASKFPPQTFIEINDQKRYQQILGFGASLTSSSAWELEHGLNQQQRDAVMQQFFDPTNGIGINLLRQSVGISDQGAPGQTCSYDDNGGRPDDASLSHFSIQTDVSLHMIELLQQAMSYNPQLQIIAAPWCIPHWMRATIDGYSTLNPAYYQLYAQYLAKFIQAYKSQTPSIPIWGIIPQNEPLYSYANFGDNMTAAQQSNFITTALGPTLAQQNLNTQILIYDHNWDHPEYAEQVLASSAAPFVEGTSWHKYAGDVSAQTTVHNMFPNKKTFFTEDSPPTFDNDWNAYMPEAANRILDILDNWSESYIQWTLVSNTKFGPGLCNQCGADVYVDPNTGAVTYSLAYYILGQFSKFVKPQAYRIDSTDQGNGHVRSAAFENPDNSIAVVVYNDSSASQTFALNWRGETFTYDLPSNGLATLTWPAN